MDFLRKFLFLISTVFFLPGCQLGYYFHSAQGQLSLLTSRVEIKTALEDPRYSQKEKKQMQLAQEARQFAIEKIGLSDNKNYTDYVQLDRPYVTYVVSAAEKKKLKAFEWKYLLVGKMPYKGFFQESLAKEEEKELIEKGYDTYVRGVSAYSTLGWFRDPLLSSMTNYREDVLVNTIIHETVHLTLYIKNSADFNERLAVFVGNKATEDFYLIKEGPSSETVQKIKTENEDETLFSAFISQELKVLETWYLAADRTDEEKNSRLKEIQIKFQRELEPKLKTKSYSYFSTIPLNNARLLVYKTYVSDLSDFEKLYVQTGKDYRKFIEACRKLEKIKNPEEELKKIVRSAVSN